VLSAAIAALSGSAGAATGVECRGERPWVLLDASQTGKLSAGVLMDLRAGLRPSSIEVCEGESGSLRALAMVVVRRLRAGRHRYSVDVTDAVTEKRVGRDLDLGTLPEDGRTLALAVAAEELLRASWAELALRGVRSPETSAPPEVRAVVASSEPTPAPRYTALGARFAIEHFAQGQTQFGADAFSFRPLSDELSMLLSLGVRRALSEPAPHGSIEARALSAELGLGLRLVRGGVLELGPFAGARALWLEFSGSGLEGVPERRAQGASVTARGGFSLAFGAASVLRSYSSVGFGVALKSFSAADAGEVVTGTAGLELFGATGIGLEF
jgi:hypothetical protein